MDHVLPCEIWLILKFQGMEDCLEPIMKFFTYLGHPIAYVVIIAIIYWCVDRKLGLRLALFITVTVSLNSILKQAIHAPRPYWVDPNIKGITGSLGFGMPSGHAQASTFWLIAGSYWKKGWLWLVLIALVFMVGLSRVYLGVHSPIQVLSGWLIGIVLISLFCILERKALPWFNEKLSDLTQLLWIFGITIFFLALGCLIVFLSEDWVMPREWICNSADDLAHKNKSILSSLGMSDIAGSSGAFLGVALGAWLMRRKGGFDTGGKCCKRVVIGILGLSIWGGLYFLLNKFVLTDQLSECMDSILHFTVFFLLLFFVIYLYPLFFRKIKFLS